MKSEQYDVAWLGTGQATMTVVPKLVDAGLRVAVVEGKKFGGTCVNFGCTPTKTLVASAYATHLARRGGDFGFSADDVQVDFAKAMSTQQENRQQTSDSIASSLSDLTSEAVYRGYASFLSPHEIQVGDKQFSAATVVVHTGTRPAAPPIEGLQSTPYLTNESLLDLETLPDHLVVVGGGYVALEFAQMFRRFGSSVTVLQRAQRLATREDEDISQLIAERLQDEDINIVLSADVHKVAATDQGIQVEYQHGNQTRSVQGTHLFIATGRAPNTDDLNLGAAGVETDERGFIRVNDTLQSSAPHIYAVGDVNGQGAFTHTSVNDGEIFWDHFGLSIGAHSQPREWLRSLSTRTPISAMYIDPPLARVGLNEREVRSRGDRALMATMPMSDIARAREKRETFGLVKVLVDASSEKLLGATVFGTGGDEVIGAFATLMQTGASYKTFRRIVFPHPTVSELMPWALDRLEPLAEKEAS